MLQTILGAYIVGAFLEFFITIFTLLFFTFRLGAGAIPGIKAAFALLAFFIAYAFAAALIWPAVCPAFTAMFLYDLRAQERQERGEKAQERRQGDGD